MAAATSLARLSHAQTDEGRNSQETGIKLVAGDTSAMGAQNRIGFKKDAHAWRSCNFEALLLPDEVRGPTERTAQPKRLAGGWDRPGMARKTLETTLHATQSGASALVQEAITDAKTRTILLASWSRA